MELSLGALMRAPRGNVGYGGRGARGGASPPEPSAWGLDQRADETGTPPARSPAAAKSPSLMDIVREEEARASRAARAARVSGWYVPDRVEPATGLRAILAEDAREGEGEGEGEERQDRGGRECGRECGRETRR